MVEVLQRVGEKRPLPKTIRVDNGPEFTSKILDRWAYLNGVELDFIRPGKPTGNALIESSNGRVREECLNENWFLSIENAREKIAAWRQHYNHDRPHRALNPCHRPSSSKPLRPRRSPSFLDSYSPAGTGTGARSYVQYPIFQLDSVEGGRSRRLMR